MPQIPVIIPVIVAGVAVGSVIKSKTPRISRRKLMSASFVAGLLNAGHAYLVYSFSPGQTVSGVTSFVPPSVTSTSWITFVAASFLAGFLMVLGVLGIAKAYARTPKGEEPEEAPELSLERESTLALS